MNSPFASRACHEGYRIVNLSFPLLRDNNPRSCSPLTLERGGNQKMFLLLSIELGHPSRSLDISLVATVRDAVCRFWVPKFYTINWLSDKLFAHQVHGVRLLPDLTDIRCTFSKYADGIFM